MLRRSRVLAGGVLGLAGALTLSGGALSTFATRTLSAGSTKPTTDTDGDNLPDMLEYVAQSDPYRADSDNDGRRDFVEVAEFTSPLTRDTAKPDPDAFRLLMNTTEESNGQRIVWLHLLFRVRSGLLSDVRGFSLFLDHRGERVSLDWIVPIALSEIRVQADPMHGALLRLTLRIPLLPPLETMSPVTFGAYCDIRSTVHRSGSVLFSIYGDLFTLVPLGGLLFMHAANPVQATSPFWSSNKACTLSMQVQGAGKGWVLCEVDKASCEVSQTMQCVPDCAALKGHTIFVPDGLGLILGG
jgi:hypothetical protein